MSWIELAAQRRPSPVPEGVTPPDNAADWYRIENSADTPDETDVYVYDAIGGWFGTTADDFIRDLKDISSSQINLRLNSPGGSVFEGITIANAIRTHPASVTVYVDGLAASIASVIALAGNRLVMMPQSQMMIHDASGGCYGNAADMEYMVGLLNKQSDNIADAYADRAGGTSDEWRDLMRAETWYTAKEAVAAGLADEVMETPAKDPAEDALAAKMQSVWNLTAYRYAGREAAPTPANLPTFANIGETVPCIALPKSTSPPAAKVEIVLGGNPVDVGNDIVELIRTSVKAKAKQDESPPAVVSPDLLETLRAVIREELSVLKAALPPFLQPDEDEEEEEEEDPDKKKQDTEDAAAEEAEDDSVEAVLIRAVREALRAEVGVLTAAIAPNHSTAVEDGAWDAGANEKRLSSPVPVATAKKVYTYYDEEQVEDGAVAKTACKLPHHFVSEDGTPGAASINGVRNALARLPQTQGLSDDEREKAEAHLRQHLNAYSDDETDDSVTPSDTASGDTAGDEDSTVGNTDDVFSSLVAHLTESPSPSADDIFNRLKEAL